MQIFPTTKNRSSALQSRLFSLAAICLFLLAIVLTLSPVVRYRSWNVDLRWSHWAAFFIWLAGASFIHRLTLRRLENWDALILPAAFLLAGWGMLTIWRLSIIFGIRQTLWYMVSIGMAALYFRIDDVLDILRRFKYVILTLGLILAILTFFFGTYPGGNGPNLWLGFHGIYFQPSELLKLILIIYLAAFFSDKYFLRFNLLQTILPSLILFLSALFILVGQRDMGTSLIFIVIYVGMLYIIFGKKRILAFGAVVVALAAAVGYFLIDLIRIRFQAWTQPWLDPQSGSYQIIQSTIAIAAGGILGSGIGMGYPGLVPIPHSDFIYSSVIEETGMVGSIALIGLFTLLMFRGIQAAIKTNNKYYRFLASGITIYLTFQTFLIVGGNIRLLPITGVTLPLMSYGGSSLVTSMLAILILVKISDYRADLARDLHSLLPFRNLAALCSIGLASLALVTGWWAVVRSHDLQLRRDNARNFIAARYVERGSILDRNNQAITATLGSVGNFSYNLQYPALSNTIGYFDYAFGMSNLEEKYNDYLSGERGYSTPELWFNYLLYNQPLPGRDIRLTLDLPTQSSLDNALGESQGAALVMNAQTGEILAISSSPAYNANTLARNFTTWKSDATSPLLNRASQGSYPLGELLTPFLISENEALLQTDYSETAGATSPACAIRDQQPQLWSEAVASGCRAALRLAANGQNGPYITSLVSKYGLTAVFNLGLPENPVQKLDEESSWQNLVLGQNRIRVSPLQVAYAFSIFSNQGRQSSPHLLAAVNLQQEGWIETEQASSTQVITVETAEDISRLLASQEISGWELTTESQDANGSYAWYVAGTPVNWPGTPVVLVIVREDMQAENLQALGRQVFQSITNSL